MTIQALLSDSISTIVLIVVALAIVIIFMAVKRYKENVVPKRKLESNNYDRSIKIVKKIVERYVRRNDGRTIYSIEVGSNKTKGSVDVILIGYFGVLVIVTNDLRGDLYANDRDLTLTQIVKTERRSHENPIIKSKTAAKAVIELLREKRVFKVPVESCVVFTGKKAGINVPGTLGGYSTKEFAAVLKTSKFLDDKNVDVDLTANVILGMGGKPTKKPR